MKFTMLLLSPFVFMPSDASGEVGEIPEDSAWVGQLFEGFRQTPANRLCFSHAAKIPGRQVPAVRVVADYAYRDAHGQKHTGKAKLYLPDGLRRRPQGKLPLYYSAGYETTDDKAATFLDRGWVVVSPAEVTTNPLIRTMNADSALLHIARALPFVDDARVVIGGASAGGYMTLMLAAETFPLAGAAPDAAPINLGYNAAYWFRQKDLVQGTGSVTELPPVPGVAIVVMGLHPMETVYGSDFGDLTWARHSPLAHVNTITCPVSAFWSTGDVLVPIDQVGQQWVKPIDPGKFPEGFTMNAEQLTETPEGQLRLTDVLPEADYEVFEVPVPEGSPRFDPDVWKDALRIERKHDKASPSPTPVPIPAPLEMPVSRSTHWSIVIRDEGPSEPDVGHTKYLVGWLREEFLRNVMNGRIATDQLTPLKLERLMDRYAGKEWLPTELKHLDEPASERTDVLRGLTTYVTADPKNAAAFAELYGRLPPARRVLEPEVLTQLIEAH